MSRKFGSGVKKPGQEIEYTQELIDEYTKCFNDVAYFIKYVKIIDPDEGRVFFEPRPYQWDIINAYKKERRIIGLMSRQLGKSTTIAVIALHYALFNSDKTIGIVSNKESAAKDILARIQTIYEDLPNWLKLGAPTYAKTSVKFENNTEILAAATSKDAFRGRAIQLLVCDEFAFVTKSMAEDFWAANFPTLSASKRSKIIIISCVTDDTFVFTNKGPKQIKHFVNNKQKGGYEIEKYSVLGKNNLYSGNLFVNNEKTKTKIIETTNSILEGSLNHKLWACKNGTFGWYKISELTENDYISLKYGMNLWGNNDVINFKSPKRRNKQGVSLNVPKITEDWAYLFGLYLSEGYADKYRLCISCGDDISSVFDRLNLKYSCNDDMHYTICCQSLIDLLKFVGFDITKKAPEKEIPQRLMEMSDQNIKALLRGIFDGDGYSRKDKGNIGIGLSSKKMINQIRMLLLNFGILTDYYEATTPQTKKVKVEPKSYRIQADKNSSKLFYEIIGFNIKRKQDKGKILKNLKENKRDIIPYSKKFLRTFSSMLKPKNKYGVIRDIENVLQKPIYNRGPNGHLSRKLMLEIKENLHFINHPQKEEIRNFFEENVSQNIKWCKIKKIKESENKVYDFSLPEIKNDKWCHSILYNGNIGHQTPNGMFNLFHRLWIDAELDKNGFKPLKATWKDFPGRDKKWKKQEIAAMGKQKFRQEHECEFLGSTNIVVDRDVLDTLMKQNYEPIMYDLGDALRVYEKPKPGIKYILGVDTAKGTGEHWSAIQILKVNGLNPIDFEQVAVYENNEIDVYKYAAVVYRLALYYNNAYVLCENNSEGSTIVSRLWWEYEYEGLVNESQKSTGLGIRATKQTKPKAVLLMKKLIEENMLKLFDKRTIECLASFEDKGNNVFKGEGMPDDLVSALYWATYAVDRNELWDEDADFTSEEEDEPWGILSDVDMEQTDWLWMHN